MKLGNVCFSLAVLLVTASSGLHAQTCVSPQIWQPPPEPFQPTLVATTCGGDTTATAYCAGNQSAPGPAYVFHSTFAANRTFTTIALSGGAAGFDPVMYMSAFASGCGTNAACGPSGDTGFPIASADVSDGDWYIIVTAASIDAAGACGSFGISSNGSFPVTLTNFTVD